jgi:hypothetical protein
LPAEIQKASEKRWAKNKKEKRERIKKGEISKK